MPSGLTQMPPAGQTVIAKEFFSLQDFSGPLLC